MKYFTLPWWSSAAEGIQKPFDGYQAYIDSIFKELPGDLQRLSREISLHDAHLRVFHFDSSIHLLQLELDGNKFGWGSSSFDARPLQLSYHDVRSIQSTADPLAGLPGPWGYGDLGYDEIEIIEPGLYEHRMLFSTGIELQVRFSNFSFSFKDA